MSALAHGKHPDELVGDDRFTALVHIWVLRTLAALMLLVIGGLLLFDWVR